MATIELNEYDVTVKLARRIGIHDGRVDNEYREFTLRIPAVSPDAAMSAGYAIGIGINEGCGHVWKLAAEGAVTVTPASAVKPGECPDCAHRIAAHVTRVGDNRNVCSSCSCDRYINPRMDERGKELIRAIVAERLVS